jgi:hypothetical protein
MRHEARVHVCQGEQVEAGESRLCLDRMCMCKLRKETLRTLEKATEQEGLKMND